MIINFTFIATPTSWLILIFGIGFVTGFAIYIMIQFDLKFKARNRIDWHYTTWLISLPATIGMNLRFQPKSFVLRTFIFFHAFSSFMACQFIFWFAITYIKTPTPRLQISTISEIIDYKYQLFGSFEVLPMISHDKRVNIYDDSHSEHDSVKKIRFFFSMNVHKSTHFLCAKISTVV